MKKLTYISNSRIPTKFAYGVQIMKMCEEFANQGIEVELILPARWQKIKEDPFKFYGVKKNFKIKKLWTLDLVRLKIPGFFTIEVLTFGFSIILYLFFRKERGAVYTRGEMVRFITLFSKKYDIFWESHNKPDSIDNYSNILKKVKGIIVLTEYYKKELAGSYNVTNEKIIAEHDGVDATLINESMTKEDARKKLNLPIDKKIVVYTGSDIPWKGLDVLRNAAAELPDNHETYFIGNIKQKSSTNKHLHFVGFKTPSEIPTWLFAADVLVVTESNESEVAKYYTSPLKLFEYMAAGRPVVASDTIALREVLSENNSVLVKTGDIEAMKKGIQSLTEDIEKAGRIAINAHKDVKQYTWEKRVKNIVEFIDFKSK